MTVIIEVKGCWNKELNQAMETQPVDRYLKDNNCQHGLYLVGWFNCNCWSDEDERKKQAPQSVDEAQKEFDQQASSLSLDTKVIKAFLMNTALS